MGNFTFDQTNLDAPFTVEELSRVGIDSVKGVGLVAFDVKQYRDTNGHQSSMLPLAQLLIRKGENLLVAAPLMYRGLGAQIESLESLKIAIASLDLLFRTIESELEMEPGELPDLNPVLEGVDRQIDQCLDMRRIAEQGVESVANAMIAEARMTVDKRKGNG